MNKKKDFYLHKSGSKVKKSVQPLKEWVCIWVDGESCNKKGYLAPNSALDNIGTWFHEW